LAALLQSDGRHEGRQLLSATKLAEALYRTSVDSGLPLGSRYRAGEARYHLSFWSVPYRTTTGCFFQIPYMSGFGGNLIVLLPNRVSVFRFADAMSYDPERMMLAGEAVRPSCTPAVTAAMAAPRVPLTATELRVEVVGRTFDSDFARLVIDRSGIVSFDSKSDFDIGRWHITDDGQYCRTWNVLDRGHPRCYRLYRDGETFELHPIDRWNVTKLRRINLRRVISRPSPRGSFWPACSPPRSPVAPRRRRPARAMLALPVPRSGPRRGSTRVARTPRNMERATAIRSAPAGRSGGLPSSWARTATWTRSSQGGSCV